MGVIAGKEILAGCFAGWHPSYIAYIRELHYSCVPEEGAGATLELLCFAQPRDPQTLWPRADRPFWEVRIRFDGVRSFQLNTQTAGDIQVIGFSLEDVSDRQLEGIGVEVSDYEDQVVSFVARSALVLSCSATSEAPQSWPSQCIGPAPAPGTT